MTLETHVIARGKVVQTEGAKISFNPEGSTYRLHLASASGAYSGPVGVTVEGVIRVAARKIWTVGTGGSFIAPITGQPRILQGRIRSIDEKQMVVNGGVSVVVSLPDQENAIDLDNGPLAVGQLVNVVVLPGAIFEYVPR